MSTSTVLLNTRAITVTLKKVVSVTRGVEVNAKDI
jgi:hypothetical protein